MPIPLIIGAAALAAGAFGAKKGYDGYQKHSEADEIVKNAMTRYENNKKLFDDQEKDTLTKLDSLGSLELEIGKNFNEFNTLANSLLAKINQSGPNKLEINIPKAKLQKIEKYSYSAIGVLGSVVGAGAAGTAAGFAVYGGVMAFGAASTGATISSLAGVAATNATLAAIGGGSLAAGGLGIMGGTAILGAAVAAPVLAIAGWAYNSHGEEALKNARKAKHDVENVVQKLTKALKKLSDIAHYATKIRDSLQANYIEFEKYFNELKNINSFIEDLEGRNVDKNAEISKLGDSIMQTIENGYAFAAILTDLICTPIFKFKESNGEVLKDDNGTPVMDTDADGSTILNVIALNAAISTAKTKVDTKQLK